MKERSIKTRQTSGRDYKIFNIRIKAKLKQKIRFKSRLNYRRKSQVPTKVLTCRIFMFAMENI